MICSLFKYVRSQKVGLYVSYYYTLLSLPRVYYAHRFVSFGARRYASAAYAVKRCLSVRLSRSWTLSKGTKLSSKFFSPSGCHTILVLP